MSNDSVPRVEGVDQLAELVSNTARYADLRKKFAELYKSAPTYFARAPGRVNLIGEHIDYSGYSVLPMAIDRDTVIAVRANPDSKVIRIANVNDKYPAREYTTETAVIIDATKHEWSNYFLCGFRGVIEAALHQPTFGFDALVHGTVPIGSGLSSSAALVCAAAIATQVAYSLSLTRHQLADISAKAENWVGVQSGGMDQAISFLGKKGSASLIHFNPIRDDLIPLPAGAEFIVANSLVEANKYTTAETGYNVRVAETKLAAALLANEKHLAGVKNLHDYQKEAGLTLDQAVQHVVHLLHKAPYTVAELVDILGIPEAEVRKNFIGDLQSSHFHLYERALHVFTEANLVQKFATISHEAALLPELKAQMLGKLMDESHQSCRDDFDCSCAELNRLTTIAKSAGALGSRLTGAGWGGATVSIVPHDKVASFLETLKQEYYAKEKPAALENFGDVIFATSPGAGAFVYFPK